MSIHAGDPDDDDDADDPSQEGPGRRFGDFDCPDCSANNPYDDAFGNGDEIRCYYCGAEYLVMVTEAGRLRLKAI
jgi:DNA-directed RNA polymerase subunit RPC12/RpoP